MAQRLRRKVANLVSRKRFPGSNPGPGVIHFWLIPETLEKASFGLVRKMKRPDQQLDISD